MQPSVITDTWTIRWEGEPMAATETTQVQVNHPVAKGTSMSMNNETLRHRPRLGLVYQRCWSNIFWEAPARE